MQQLYDDREDIILGKCNKWNDGLEGMWKLPFTFDDYVITLKLDLVPNYSVTSGECVVCW